MYKLSDLLNLEKNCNIHLAMVEFLIDEINEEKNTRRRIVKDSDGRYFYHSMKDGEVTDCFEIFLHWHPICNRMIFAYTPDGRHPYEIEANLVSNRMFFRERAIPMDDLIAGDKAEYNGNTVEFVDDETIKINGKIVSVERDTQYTYKLLKSKIRANNGARGLFHFLDGIAEEGKFTAFPFFSSAFDAIAEMYGKVCAA